MIQGPSYFDPDPDPYPLPPSLAEVEAADKLEDELEDELEDNSAPGSSGILASVAHVYAFPVAGTVIGSHIIAIADAAVMMEALGQAWQAGKDNLALVVTGGAEAEQTEIIVPGDSLQLLVTAGLNLFVFMSRVGLEMPAETLASVEQEQGLDINVAAVTDKGTQFSLVGQEQELLFQNNLFGEPLQITTSFEGRTRVVFPLPENSMSLLQAERLYIYVEHSDGEIVLLDGEPYFDASGTIVGIGGWIDRFSIFALLEARYKKVLFLQPGFAEVMVNGGQTVSLDVPPFIHGEAASLMAPVRFLGETLGGRVSFLQQESKITINKNKMEMSLVIGCDKLMVDGRETVLPHPVSLVGGRAFAPVRLLSEALGAGVHWDGEERKAFVRERW